MKNIVCCVFLLMFASAVCAQNDETKEVTTSKATEAENAEASSADEEIENFDFLYNEDGNVFNYDNVLVENLVNEAFKHIGTRYRFGSKGPKAFDCSGFTSYVFKKSNMNIGSNSREQYASNIPIQRDELQPGDLVFFTSHESSKGVGHVGMVIDYDPKSKVFTFIHSSTKAGVKISKSDEATYTKRYIGARRVKYKEHAS